MTTSKHRTIVAVRTSSTAGAVYRRSIDAVDVHPAALLRSSCLLLPLLAACPAGGDGSATDTDAVPGCECIPDDEGTHAEIPSAPTCGEGPCPTVQGSCEVCEEVPPVSLSVDTAALECALVALRDRTPGLITWSWDTDSGYGHDEGYLLVHEDGTAVRRSWRRLDLIFEASDAEVGELPAPAVFDACLAEPDDRARFDCLRTELATQHGVCDEGWYCPDCA